MNIKKQKPRIVILLTISIVVLFFAKVSLAANYYVSPSGTNTWPNCISSDNPCEASATHKEFLNAVAGDTIYFLPGTYNPGNAPDWEHPAWNPYNPGNSENTRITFKCLTAGTCEVLPNNVGASFGSNGRDYITWNGFSGTKAEGVTVFTQFRYCNYGMLLNCDLKGSASTSSNTAPVGANTVTYLVIRNNKLRASYGGRDTLNNCALLSYFANNTLMENNDIYGVSVVDSTGIYDKSGGRNNTYRYNFFHNLYNSIAVMTDNTPDIFHNIFAYQNVFVNTGNAFNSNVDDSGSTNVYFYNNDIYNSTSISFVSQGVGIDGVNSFNNIFFPQSAGSTFEYSGPYDSNVYMDYNVFYGLGKWSKDRTDYYSLSDWRAIGYDTNSNTNNPNFVNPGGNLASDYKRTSYPTNGRGGNYPNVMGAYITGNEIIGYTKEAEATKIFYYDNSDQTPGTAVTNNGNPYAYNDVIDTVYYRNTTPRSGGGNYVEFSFSGQENEAAIEVENPYGTYGTTFSERNPLVLSDGATYYLGAFFRFERIGGNNIWTSLPGDYMWDFDKLLEMHVTGFRWGISSGGAYSNIPSGKFAFELWREQVLNCGSEWEHLYHNQGSYSQSNPYLCDYEKWYSVVIGITAAKPPNVGRYRLWVNGILLTDLSTCPTMTGTPAIDNIVYSGTVGQPGYDAPAHKRQFDGIILTNNWQDIVDGGYLRDPNQGVFNRADTNQNGCIETQELISFISQWKNSIGINLQEVIDAIMIWKNTCPN